MNKDSLALAVEIMAERMCGRRSMDDILSEKSKKYGFNSVRSAIELMKLWRGGSYEVDSFDNFRIDRLESDSSEDTGDNCP